MWTELKAQWTDINNLMFKYGIRNTYISKDINKLRSQGVAIQFFNYATVKWQEKKQTIKSGLR